MSEERGDWSRWPAPAKLNLFLRITGRRADGYHLLQTAFQLLDWGDGIELRLRADGAVQRHGGAFGIEPEADLTVRAARRLQQLTATGCGVDIRIDKRIPLGGGFGGGSSDAATVLVALNHLWRLGLDEDRLAAIGLELGADVPLFVRGRSAWAEGVGEQLTPLELPRRYFLLLDPGISVSTAELFQAPELTRNEPPITIADFVSGGDFGNTFEPVLRARAARIDRALDALGRFGRARLTGSGGGCFVAFDREEDAEAARRVLAAEWRVCCAAGVLDSPLLARLGAARTATGTAGNSNSWGVAKW